jgi:arginase
MSRMKRKIALLDAPSNLGLRPPQPGHLPGVWRLPGALRRHGLLERLGAHDAGAVQPPAYSAEPDSVTGFRNGPSIAAFTAQLAKRVSTMIGDGFFPLVLGGDCSILLGNLLALRGLGQYGLCFLDGHQDFAYPRTNERLGYFAAAGLDLALSTGRGPDALTNLHGLKPYVKEADVVALGFYDDPADAADYETDALYGSQVATIPIDAVRSLGGRRAALASLQRLSAPHLEGFWIHLDADVLDQAVMPAVDSPNPRGLAYEELLEILQALLGAGRVAGLEVTILDPELDPDGRCTADFARLLITALS